MHMTVQYTLGPNATKYLQHGECSKVVVNLYVSRLYFVTSRKIIIALHHSIAQFFRELARTFFGHAKHAALSQLCRSTGSSPSGRNDIGGILCSFLLVSLSTSNRSDI